VDHATFVNAPFEISLDGRKWLVSALTFHEWGPIQAWIKKNVPGPLSAFTSEAMAGLNDQDRRIVLESASIAQRAWPPKIGTMAWFSALDNPGGQAEFLRAALGKHQPGITSDECELIADRVTLGDVVPIVMACLGIDAEESKAQGRETRHQSSKTIPPANSRTNLPKRSTGRIKKSAI
jgi:hypothetical protein